jgi:hypothetical protein
MTNEDLVLTFLIVFGIVGNWLVAKRIVENEARRRARMVK